MLHKILFSLLTVVLFFALLEGILRLVYHPTRPFRFYAPHALSVVERDPDLGYRLRPGFRGEAYASRVETNSLGFRGDEFDAEHKTRFRIIALGDSCTFGFGVSDNAHTYPARLSELLVRSGRNVEVINAGVVGYTSYQVLKRLERDIVPLHPDTLLVYVGWNDLGNSILPDWKPTMTQDVERPSLLASPPFILLALSDLLSRFRPKPALGFKQEAVDAYASNLRNIVAVADRAGIRPVLLTWPTRVVGQIANLRGVELIPGSGVGYESWLDYYRRYQNQITRLGEQTQTTVIPLAEQLNEGDPLLYFDEIHLTDVGSMKAAEVVYSTLAESIPQNE